MTPFSRPSILRASLSTQITSWPTSDRHAPETRPTYPVPIIVMRIGGPQESEGDLNVQEREKRGDASLAVAMRRNVLPSAPRPDAGCYCVTLGGHRLVFA